MIGGIIGVNFKKATILLLPDSSLSKLNENQSMEVF